MRSKLLKPMFAALIDHGYASYIDLRDRMSLTEAARLEDQLFAKVENERRARQAAGQNTGNDAPTVTTRRGRKR